jgi:hypothetical protein
MIREATDADIPRLLHMGAKFAEKARLVEHVGYDPANMENTFAEMIAGENYAVFIGDSGAIGGLKSPHPFNYSHWIAQELFWWSEGREGLRLLTAFELWASAHCQTVRMITLECVNPERMGRLYLSRGYEPLEHGYIKRL